MAQSSTASTVSSTSKVIITGATGMIGSALVRSWQGEPIHVVRLVRRPPPSSDASGGETLLWNPNATPVANLDRLAGAETVIHLSGANIAAHRWTPAYKREIVTSRVDSTLALAQAITRLDPMPRVLVCASAIGIYGDRGDQLLTEDASPGTGFLATTCSAWEHAARPAEDAGIRVVHARFGVVLSPTAGALARLVPLFRLGLGGNLGDGRAWMPWITLADAVAVLRYCIQNEALKGPVNTVAPQAVVNAEFTRDLAAALHRPAIVPAPAFALRLAFGQMADEAMLASARVVPQKLLEAGFHFDDPEIAPALRRLLSP
jgi:uncharacterized protein (TIGR01777 family)